MVLSRVIELASFLAVVKGYRETALPKSAPARIGAFYLLLRVIATRFRIRYLGEFALYGLTSYLLVSVSRFAPDVLGLPPSATGKTAQGNLSFPMCLSTLPFLFLERLRYQYLMKTLVRKKKMFDDYNAITDQCYLGVCPTLTENFPSDVDMICDFCNEFAKSSQAQNKDYCCYPIWDQCVPQEKEKFLSLVDRLAAYQGTMYFHCAFGLGRSTIPLAAVLMKRGVVKSPKDALTLIQKKRPQVRWSPDIIQYMESITPRLLEGGHETKD